MCKGQGCVRASRRHKEGKSTLKAGEDEQGSKGKQGHKGGARGSPAGGGRGRGNQQGLCSVARGCFSG